MKLFASILTTTAITGAIWAALHTQPAIADAKTQTNADASENTNANAALVTASNDKTDMTKSGSIIGVTKTVALDSVPQVWALFYEQVESNNNPNLSTPNVVGNEVIVLYQDITKDFSEAKVTVGFVQNATSDAKPNANFPSIKQAVTLLNKGQHDDTELTNAWEMIDFRREVKAVLERHYLNQHGLPDSSELYVYYK